MIQHERHVVGIPEGHRRSNPDVHLVSALIGIVARGALALRPNIAQQKLNLYRNRHPVEIGKFPLELGPWGKIWIVDL